MFYCYSSTTTTTNVITTDSTPLILLLLLLLLLLLVVMLLQLQVGISFSLCLPLSVYLCSPTMLSQYSSFFVHYADHQPMPDFTCTCKGPSRGRTEGYLALPGLISPYLALPCLTAAMATAVNSRLVRAI